MRLNLLTIYALTLAALGLATPALSDDPPVVSPDGLHLVPDTKIGIVYVDPEADFFGYDSVKIDPAEVAFKKDWRRDQRRDRPRVHISDKDMENLRGDMSKIFGEAVTDVFDEQDSWHISDTAAENVLWFRPAVIDFDPTAPDIATPGMTRTFSSDAGSATLYLELHDSVTGDKLAWVMSGIEVDPNGGFMSMSNSVVNSQEARREVKRWATMLRNGLDEVKAHGLPETN